MATCMLPQHQQQQQQQRRQQQQRHKRRLTTRRNFCCLCLLLLVCCSTWLLPQAIEAKVSAAAPAAASGSQSASNHNNSEHGSNEAADILQLPHAFRHQEHYSHRIEQAVNDFKRVQLEQQQLKERDKGAPLALAASNNARELRHLQIAHALQPAAAFVPHHRRHEKHLQQQQFQDQLKLQHRLRHQNRQQPHAADANEPPESLAATEAPPIETAAVWESRHGAAIPPMRHLQHRYKLAATTVGPYKPSPPLATATESAPGAAATGGNELGALVGGGREAAAAAADGDATDDLFDSLDGVFANTSSGKPHRYFDRDGLFVSSAAPWHNTPATRGPKLRYNEPAAAERMSLNLNVNGAPVDWQTSAGNGEDGASDEDDSYSYEDSQEDDQEDDVNEFPSVSAKTSVKRYTNPFVNPFKSAAPAKRSRGPGGMHAAAADDDADDDADDSAELEFTSEKWHKIEREHHLRQQQHHRELQALRSRHGGVAAPAASSNNVVSNDAPFGGASEQQPEKDKGGDIFARYYITGTLTKHKQEQLGTSAAVQGAADRAHQAMRHIHSREMASAHLKQMMSEASCRIPQRRIEHIQKDTAKIYTPYCTVLHRCGDDTGCCRSERQTCAPKRTKSVELYFFVRSINDKRGNIERLTFVNHTECHCVEKSPHHTAAEYSNSGAMVLQRATILNCNCPRLYEKILQEDGACRCDCSSGNSGCDWLKRGMEHFSMYDRKCLLEGRCKPPTCEYGIYIKKHGRCPRREEQLSAVLSGDTDDDGVGATEGALGNALDNYR